jgi:hypothetical protein
MLIDIYFHVEGREPVECGGPAVPRLGETVILNGAFTVAEVHWEADDPLDIPYVHVHLEPRIEKAPTQT